MEKQNKKVRMSNFELMKIISMFFIILWHFITRSNIYTNSTGSFLLLIKFVQFFIIVHVNSFILVTGYFHYKNDIKIKKIFSLIFQSWFYRIAFVLIFLIFGLSTLSKIDLGNGFGF